MEVRFFEPKDYEEVMLWWKAQDWPPMPLEMLSQSGFIVEENGEKLAATWVFPTNCPIYIMEWTVGNPECDWEKRADAIDLVTNKACDWAKAHGASMIFTMTKNERFIDKLKNNNFEITDNGMTHLMRRV